MIAKAPFPPGKDGEVDVMVLVERREMIETFMKEVVTTIDFEMYDPLDKFIEGTKNMQRLKEKLSIVVKFIRSKIVKKILLPVSLVNLLVHYYDLTHLIVSKRLFRFYSKELMDFVYTMENGIEVYNIDVNLPMNRKKNSGIHVLWLDVCEEPGLSRLCIAPKEIFDLPKEYEDERLAYGVFLSDIAEVRRGLSSHAFSLLPAQSLHSSENEKGWVKAEQCVSIVGSERTLAFQFLATVPLSSRPQKPSTARLHIKSGFDIHRLLFLDMLSLLICQSMATEELQVRNRHLIRHLVHPSLRTFPQQCVERKVQVAGKKTADLLMQGIDIEVEIRDNSFGRSILFDNGHVDSTGNSRAVNRFLKFDAAQNALIITDREGEAQATSVEDVGTDSMRDHLANIVEEEEEGDGEYDEEDTSGEEDDDDHHAPVEDVSAVPVSIDNIHQHWWFTGTQIWSSNGAANGNGNGIGGEKEAKRMVIPLDDLAEIRPGRVSSLVDSPEDLHSCISFISSKAILVLPLGNLQLRNTLLQKFQSFLMMYRDLPRLFATDQPSPDYLPQSTSPVVQQQYRAPLFPALSATLATSHTVAFSDVHTPTKATTPSAAKKKDKKKKSKSQKATFDVPIGATPLPATVAPTASAHRFITPVHARVSRVSVSSIRRSSTSSRGQLSFSFTPSITGVLPSSHSGRSNSDSFTPFRNLTDDD